MENIKTTMNNINIVISLGFWMLATDRTWEALRSLHMMPRGMQTFSTLENLILQTFICLFTFLPLRAERQNFDPATTSQVAAFPKYNNLH